MSIKSHVKSLLRDKAFEHIAIDIEAPMDGTEEETGTASKIRQRRQD